MVYIKRGTAGVSVVVALLVSVVAIAHGAASPSPCANSLQVPNELTTVSADGSAVHGSPACGSGSLNKLRNIDELEGTNYGDSHENNLLGRPGEDQIWARGGDDNIEAKDGEFDKGGGSTGADTCTLDGIDSFAGCP